MNRIDRIEVKPCMVKVILSILFILSESSPHVPGFTLT